MIKVSSDSRPKKREGEVIPEAANVMKPCSELNLGARVDLEWVLFCFEVCGWGLRKAVGCDCGAGEGMSR
jgi:hypothetical protein